MSDSAASNPHVVVAQHLHRAASVVTCAISSCHTLFPFHGCCKLKFLTSGQDHEYERKLRVVETEVGHRRGQVG